MNGAMNVPMRLALALAGIFGAFCLLAAPWHGHRRTRQKRRRCIWRLRRCSPGLRLRTLTILRRSRARTGLFALAPHSDVDLSRGERIALVVAGSAGVVSLSVGGWAMASAKRNVHAERLH